VWGWPAPPKDCCCNIPIALVDQRSKRIMAFYEKVIKVKADVAAFYEKVIKVKADVAAFLINCFPSA
jgi:hypothetical protein